MLKLDADEKPTGAAVGTPPDIEEFSPEEEAVISTSAPETTPVDDRVQAVTTTGAFNLTINYNAAQADPKLQATIQQIAGDNQPAKPADEAPPESKSLFIWKENDTYRWLAAYSNNRRDNDDPPEIISSASHKEFDQALQEKQWPMPELWPWHIPFPVGIATFHAYDEASGFPIAGGVFYKGMEWAAEGMEKAGWSGVSHGMPTEWIQRGEKGDATIITRHRTKEISPLPPQAAANQLTFNIISKETTMDDTKGLPPHKRDEFIAAFGEDRVKQIEAALADKAKEADDAGIEKKEAPPITEVLKQVMEGLEFLATEVKGIKEEMAKVKAEPAEKEADPFDLVATLKSLSAIGNPTAKLDGRSKEAKDGPAEAAPLSATEQSMGMRLGVIDQFIQANQAYYNQGQGTN